MTTTYSKRDAYTIGGVSIRFEEGVPFPGYNRWFTQRDYAYFDLTEYQGNSIKLTGIAADGIIWRVDELPEDVGPPSES